jgi:hypothetical protein
MVMKFKEDKDEIIGWHGNFSVQLSVVGCGPTYPLPSRMNAYANALDCL